jgi:hypothetical protein
MPRLPQPGSDDGTWGDILNTYLSVEHKSDGSQKPLPQSTIIDLEDDLAAKADTTDLAGKLTASNNLSDVDDPAEALANLGGAADGAYVEVSGAEQIVNTPLVFTGGKPWWDATNLATLQTSIAAAEAAGGGEVRVAVSIALGTTSITVPNTVDVKCVGEGRFTYAGTGSAITFDGQLYGTSVIRMARTNIGWEAADLSDTSSVGATLKNSNFGDYRFLEVQNFETGILLWGDATGTAYNNVTLGRVNDNKRGIRFAASGGVNGHANANSFWGGVVRISNFGGTAGTRYIDLSTTGNGNTFTSVCLEGSAPEKVVEVASVDNVFINCRMEANNAGTWHFLTASARNIVIGGGGLLGPADAKFLDDSTLKQNVIIGGRGMNLASDSNNAAYTSRALSSNADVSYKAYNISGQVTAKILGGGQFEHYIGTDTLPRVKTDVTGGPGGYGGIFFGRGNVAPTVSLGVSTNGFGLKTSNVLGLGTSTTAARPSAASAGAGGEWYDTTLAKPVWSDGTVWRDAAGTAV